jgi:hypothetical protein
VAENRPDSPQWVIAKAEGDHAELAVAQWFRARGYEPFKALGQASYDLLLQTTAEVKHDLRAAETGNVAIEIQYSGQGSGIVNSPATFWAIVVGQEAMVVKTATLRGLVFGHEWPERRAGDGHRSLIRLVPVEMVRAAPDVRVIQLPEPTP